MGLLSASAQLREDIIHHGVLCSDKSLKIPIGAHLASCYAFSLNMGRETDPDRLDGF
jgi:hypothetical protein